MKAPEEETLLDTIRHLKSKTPFEPFRIVVGSGDKYLIEIGENLVLMESQLFYAFPRSNRFVFIRSSQIAAVEQFEEKTAA